MLTFSQFIEEERTNNTQKTQVSTTGGTYRKSGEFLKDKLQPNSKILSVGAGLDHTKPAIHQGLGENNTHEVHDFEPNPSGRKHPPEYDDANDIPHNHYHAAVCHNVLNVVEPHVREHVMHSIFRPLKEGGHAVIGTRGWKGDIENNKNYELGDEPKSMWVKKKKKGGEIEHSYQKGFDGDELKDYVEDYAKRHGHTVKVTKKTGMAKSAVHVHVIKKGAI